MFAHDGGGVGVFLDEDAWRGFDQKHLRAESREGLCHLAADGSRADDADALGQFGE